ncbi:hypothetical protein Gasu_42460 isoform 1 [Galdieria sulphuraria]|uniref:Uncharacterized protein n=1 Tax=Galdieria sulphuraria TaxID=130081 RepID=M2WW65_GALSU|nr:hypothetical protein Gasu_42460 isoform 1 [Galdieria sulphuraria]EME28245.1 hypothetical protein isoform 1 [Galdieria sulphuraria]|eukprot:XP_005704765.1 hypothetical protein isoform 1 [Galdieria sulphuraria]
MIKLLGFSIVSPLVVSSCKRVSHRCHHCDVKYATTNQKCFYSNCIYISMIDGQNWTWIANRVSSAVSNTSSPYTAIYSIVFPLSTIPYLLFLKVSLPQYFKFTLLMRENKGLWKKQTVPTVAKIGFSYLLVFVLFSIVGSLLAQNLYQQTLSNVDWLHGCAEQFLSVTTFCILLGYQLFMDQLKRK